MPFQNADRLRAEAQACLAEMGLPGFSLGVVADGRLDFAEGFGFADIESGRPQSPDLRQRIGSITKTMVGLCTLALCDEGRLSLDDRLLDIVPELKVEGDGAAITVRHLLTHTSGIGEAATAEDLKDLEPTLWSSAPDTDVLGLFPKGVVLDVAPGTKWSYANLAFALLGEVVARKEGAPIAEVLRRRVFEPLGMTNSDLLDLPHPDLATGYHHALTDEVRELMLRAGRTPPEETTVDGRNIRGQYLHIRGGGAAGAVQSTVPDMARYALALLNQGQGIVRRETFAAMTGPQWAPDPRLETWGLSFQRFQHFGRFMYGHGGGVLGGWNSMLILIPDLHQALILHANISFDDFPKLVGRLLAAMIGAEAPRLEGPIDPAVLLAAPGVYEAVPGPLTNYRVSGALGRLQIVARDGGLFVYSRRGAWKAGVEAFPGDPADPGFLRLADNPLEPSGIALERDERGLVTGLRLDRLVRMVRTESTPEWIASG